MNSNSKFSAYAFVVIHGVVYEQTDDCYRALCGVYYIPHKTVTFLLDMNRDTVAYEITSGRGCVIVIGDEAYYINEHEEGCWWVTNFGIKAPYISPYTRFRDVLFELISNHDATAQVEWFECLEDYVNYSR